jgi:hypothetical protein
MEIEIGTALAATIQSIAVCITFAVILYLTLKL